MVEDRYIDSRLRAIADGIFRWLATERCFHIIVVYFTIQALWFAISDRYPMAFDESFHFGLIQLHANQWLPFFTNTPPHSGIYGAVARDPSYLYHFLLSIPYRLIRLLTSNVAVRIIFLRLLNIAMFAYSFTLFRRLLFQLNGSRAIVHTILLFFSLIPIVAFLAAQINYDNLLIPLMLWCLLATFDWLKQVEHGRISAGRTVVLISMMLLTCIVKYVFLPIMAILIVVMFIELTRQHSLWRRLWHSCIGSIRRTSIAGRLLLLIIFLVSAALFTERYAVNIWRYHSLTPECEKILRIDECLEYGPWQRDFLYAHARPSNFKPNLRDYAYLWIYWMWRRCFFAISYLNENTAPLPLPGHTAAVLAITGLGIFIGYAWSLLRRYPFRQYILIIIIVYCVTLFAETWQAYTKTAQPVAINGRYLIPFIPCMMLFIGLGFREFLRKFTVLKPYLVAACFLLFLEGGGVLTFIVQSDAHWVWQNRTVIQVNEAARRILRPVIWGSYRWQG